MIEQNLEDNELERYELREKSTYHFGANRREFVQILGAGVVVAVSVKPTFAQERRRGGQQPRRAEKLSERFHLGEDGTVTVFTSKVEVGQGSRTQITQAVAEELRLPVEHVQLIMADTDQCPDDGGTAGSRTTPSTVPRVRNAAAFLRDRLTNLAAKKLNVDPSTVTFADGRFSSGKAEAMTLVDLVRSPELSEQLSATSSEELAVVPVEKWRVLGTPVRKVTGQAVVTGQAQYPSDITRPGMLYGRVLRPASYGAKLESIDLTPAKEMEGVTVVSDGDFVGCAAPTSWQARKAVEALEAAAKWTHPDHPSSERLFEHLKSTARRRGGDAGDKDSALQTAAHKLETAYTVAYIQHAPMEPRAAVAEWSDGKLTVWTGSQQPSRVRSDLMQAFRLADDRVRVIVPDTGGGFGGKHTGEAAVEAARLAKAAGKPVSLRWTREEEFTWAYFRPAGLIEVRAGLDSAGKITHWDFTNYNSGGSALESPYNVPKGSQRVVETDSPLRQGSYRALASTANTFARESAMDELAKLAGIDPLEFRLKNLADGRLKDVLQAAASNFRWSSRRAEKRPNRGVGLACGTEKGSFVAACAEVEVVDKKIRVLSITQAYECGAIQNPANLRAQVAGAIIMGLGGALSEEMRFKDGRITNPNFAEYRVPRMDDVPELDITLLDRKDLPSIGAGETPIIAVAPAIANAIEHAVGVRSRSMPLRI